VSRRCSPHDYRATVDDARSLFDEIESEADVAVEFDAERERLTDLAETLEAVYAKIDAVADGVAVDTEELQVRLGNTLNPAIYMAGPDNENEPSSGWERLPHLRSTRDLTGGTERSRLFAETGLRKGRARLQHRLDRAKRLGESFLASQ